MQFIRFEFDGQYPPKAIFYRYCPKDPVNHWIVANERCGFCHSKIVEVRYEPCGTDLHGAHLRPPCFVCEAREAAPGQILCSVCLEWARAQKRPESTTIPKGGM